MNTATQPIQSAQLTPKLTGETISQLQPQLDLCTYAEDPTVHIRNAWTQSSQRNQRNRTLPIGTSVAMVFGGQALVCSLRKSASSVPDIYARMLPSEIALKEDISLEVWPQWRHAGCASDYFALDEAMAGMPWRWNVRRQDDAIIIVPAAQPLSTVLGLQITCPFTDEPLLELHPYAGSWVTPTTFLDRHPPIYPQNPQDAWGWLLPTAPRALELEGYRFRSVWDYAVNPILRSRHSEKESILERLVRATQHRLLVDEAWRVRATRHADVIRMLAGQTVIDERAHLYFLALTEMLTCT